MPLPTNVETLLRQCDTGIAALKIFTGNSIEVETAREGAIAYFVPDAAHPKVVVNVSRPPAVVAAYFCHEMNHAKMFVNHWTADANCELPESYVKKMVAEEVRGTEIGFRCFLELERKSLTTGVAGPDRYDMYKRAFEHGSKTNAAQNPSASPDQNDEAGFANGARMVAAIVDQRFLGPNQMMSYSEYYASDYARQMRQKK